MSALQPMFGKGPFRYGETPMFIGGGAASLPSVQPHPGLFGDAGLLRASQQTAPSFVQGNVDSMCREELAAEIRLAYQQGQFQTMGARIKHEAYIARLEERLARLVDPRIERIMAALKHVKLGVQAGDELENLKMKMQTLPSGEMEELFFVFKHAGIKRVVDILMARYIE